MLEFSRANFDHLEQAERDSLCERLAATITQRLRSDSSFHDAVHSVVFELRSRGHDLWSFDEDDKFEAWCPNYAQPSGPGIVIIFRADGPTEVTWSKG